MPGDRRRPRVDHALALRARWADGHVTATDLQVDFLNSIAAPNIEVLRHDLRTDTFPHGSFDLVHARAVLMHIPDDPEILRRMVLWLRPGGWLLLEEPDFGMWLADSDPVWSTHPDAWHQTFPNGSLSRGRTLLETDPPARTRRCRRRRRTRHHRGRNTPRRVLSPEHGRNRTAGDRRRRSHSRTGNRSRRSTHRSGLPRVRLRPHRCLGSTCSDRKASRRRPTISSPLGTRLRQCSGMSPRRFVPLIDLASG